MEAGISGIKVPQPTEVKEGSEKATASTLGQVRRDGECGRGIGGLGEILSPRTHPRSKAAEDHQNTNPIG